MNAVESVTPLAAGYRLPAEWERHEATWLAWPHQREDWPGRFGPIPWVYVDYVRQLTRYEPVMMLVPDLAVQQQAEKRFSRASVDLDRVTFVIARTDRSWTRDTIPSFVVNDRSETAADAVALVDWRFNGWAKYKNHKYDNRLGQLIGRLRGYRRFRPSLVVDGHPKRVVLEGGAIDSNGRGTLLTTEECLLSPIQPRNPGADRSTMEEILQEYLGIRRVVWLGRGIVGDDTHGHVDDLARFIDERTVVTCYERDPSDANYDALQDNASRLRRATDQDGRPFHVVMLPMPRPVVFDGQRLPASYANFYIANGAVFVPTFNDPADRAALTTLESLFPDRDIIGIHALDLVWGLGTLHCMSHEEPASPHPVAAAGPVA